ncbi:hypothetical protein DL93DRAFT_409543 [Clavulina sp. PMI_390]|nr:hypothetical protein DL93DRAFT_409543 [Clavulina sp. PMI_390]
MAFSRAFLPEILVEIMSHLSTPDLKSCALVRRSWSQEATRLLWHSIKLQVEINNTEDIAQGINTFTSFFSALSQGGRRTPYIRRLAIRITVIVTDQDFFRGYETPQTFLSVPWETITHALTPMRRLQYLELTGLFPFSHRFVPAVCQALSDTPIHAICSCLPFKSVLGEYAIWASSITNLLISDTVDYQNLPHFPHLRFIASNKINIISKFILSSPINSFCFYGGSGTQVELTMLADAVRAQASTGKSMLRSIQVVQFRNEKIFLQQFVSSLECPTLEHIHLVLGASNWSRPMNMADYAVACLEATSSSISHSLPALRSLRFDIFDRGRHTVPSERVRPEHTSSHIVTEAGLHLSTWLCQRTHPPLIRHIQLYSIGAINKDTQAGCRIVSVEATRSLALSGDIVDQSDRWEVTDSMEDINMPASWDILAQGLPEPLVLSDQRSLPVVPGPDGVIRWSNPPAYQVVGPNGKRLPLTKEAINSYLLDSSRK